MVIQSCAGAFGLGRLVLVSTTSKGERGARRSQGPKASRKPDPNAGPEPSRG
jgi:hypothetical protein